MENLRLKVHQLMQDLEGERLRGNNGHWTFDANRLVAVQLELRRKLFQHLIKNRRPR
ncbi:hypothetical protein [Pseudovibrio sp. SPO723]|uniref:hypothetical protein n=1 Tax=Nesiotobacter zosterae TaxID=392721 RepID=UPI0029C30ED9|nr:hypothetical protein [Pseudovibrio sp. SPO723]MDX5595611.1 hypothetical protein [Pseudovibrio sp. SPO723]